MPHRVADLRRELGMSRYWLREDLAKVDPVSDPVAYVVDPGAAAGRKLHDAVDLQTRDQPSEGWLPRAALLEALCAVSAADARLLERAPATDVGRWTVLYADATFRVAVESFAELAALVVAPPLAGCVLELRKCVDGGEHCWDAEVVLDEDADPSTNGPDTACSKCGVGMAMWSLHYAGW